MTVRFVWKPITSWPREQTKNRESSPFRGKVDGERWARREIGWTTTTGEQYTGWKELPSGVPLSARSEPEEMTVEQAGRIVVGWVSAAHDLATNARIAVEEDDYRRYAYRQALKHLHPDAGGNDSDAFLRLQQAIKVLDENDGAL